MSHATLYTCDYVTIIIDNSPDHGVSTSNIHSQAHIVAVQHITVVAAAAAAAVALQHEQESSLDTQARCAIYSTFRTSSTARDELVFLGRLRVFLALHASWQQTTNNVPLELKHCKHTQLN